MSVSRDEVRRIADLARLRIEDDELDRLTSEMNDILEHVDALRALDAHDPDVVPTPDARSVNAEPTAPQEPEPLDFGPDAFAPEFKDGFFLVPPPPGVKHWQGDDGSP